MIFHQIMKMPQNFQETCKTKLTLLTLGGAIWPPLVKIAPEQKIGPGRRPGLLGLLVLFSCGCFWKILRHFHAPVKNYAGFVEAG
jgi:hypothetical protein